MRIFTPEKIIKYAETRLFGDNVRPDEVSYIKIYPATLPWRCDEIFNPENNYPILEEMLAAEGGSFGRVIQKNGREPIYCKDRNLYLAQSSGYERGTRYEDMTQAYIEVKGLSSDFISLHFPDNDYRKQYLYEFYAYDLIKYIFVNEGMDDVNDIILGPVNALSEYTESNGLENPYLDYQFLNVDGKKVLNLSYVYGDQAGILIDKIMREYEALYRKTGKKSNIRTFKFGRVAGLEEEVKRHDLLYINGIIDEANPGLVYPIDNSLAANMPSNKVGLSFNPISVINETVETFEMARDKLHCRIAEKEVRETVEAINKANRRYAGKVFCTFGFVGYVSDRPLFVDPITGERDTLADELDSDEGERAAVSKIISSI